MPIADRILHDISKLLDRVELGAVGRSDDDFEVFRQLAAAIAVMESRAVSDDPTDHLLVDRRRIQELACATNRFECPKR